MSRQITPKEVRDYLVDYFQSKEAFRTRTAERIAERHPDKVAKNECYAKSLSACADYVAGLPDNDANLKRLAECSACYNEAADMFDLPSCRESGSSEWDNQAIHCGPRGRAASAEQIAEFFQEWVDTVLEQAPEVRAEEEEQFRRGWF